MHVLERGASARGIGEFLGAEYVDARAVKRAKQRAHLIGVAVVAQLDRLGRRDGGRVAGVAQRLAQAEGLVRQTAAHLMQLPSGTYAILNPMCASRKTTKQQRAVAANAS